MELFSLKGKQALVTGSSQGIGFAMAEGLGRAGARLVLNGRDKVKLESAHKELVAKGLDVQSAAFDVTDEAAVNDAIAKMLRAINDYKIIGVETTLDFCTFVLKHDAFISGKFDTGFISKYFTPEMLNNTGNENNEALAIAASYIFNNNKKQAQPISNGSVKKSKWRENRLKD